MTTGGEGDTEDELDGLRQEVIFLRHHLVTSMELQDKQLKDCRVEINELKNAVTGLNSSQGETYSLPVEVGQKTQLSLQEISRKLDELGKGQGLGFSSGSAVDYTNLSYMEWARIRSIPPHVPGSTRRSQESVQSRDSSDQGPPERWVDDPPYLHHRP